MRATIANTLASASDRTVGGNSTKRIALEAGHQTENGNGNGIDGGDETSEEYQRDLGFHVHDADAGRGASGTVQ